MKPIILTGACFSILWRKSDSFIKILKINFNYLNWVLYENLAYDAETIRRLATNAKLPTLKIITK